MSVLKSNQAVFYPVEGNPKMGRYIDIKKFVSMLFKSSLFFVRVSKLEDPYEGMYPRRTKEEMLNWLEKDNKVKPTNQQLTGVKINEIVEEQINTMPLMMREMTCVNCWHSYENENYLLWKAYSNTEAGIMILSTYEKLETELNNFDKEFKISKIEYCDYDEDTFGIYNSNLPFIHKPHFYADEKEIRAIHEVSETNWIHDWDNETNENGIYVQVNLQNLIDEIIVAPFAPKWYFELVESLNEKYSLNKPIKYSKLKRTD